MFVNDQETAERVYTQLLGFVKKEDIPVGEFRWLTVVSPDATDGVELLLEPTAHPAALAYQEAIYHLFSWNESRPTLSKMALPGSTPSFVFQHNAGIPALLSPS